MAEAIFVGAVLAIVLGWIGHSASKKDSFVLHFSRGAFMCDLKNWKKNGVRRGRDSGKAPLSGVAGAGRERQGFPDLNRLTWLLAEQYSAGPIRLSNVNRRMARVKSQHEGIDAQP
jgi:hypothetical protein